MGTLRTSNINEELQNIAPSKLVVKNVNKVFSSGKVKVDALSDINFKVEEGEFVCFVGPSGCGKSTLLNIIAGLDKPTSGEVLVDDVPVSGPGRDRMVMFQEHALFPWLDVLHNVLFGLNLKPNLTNPERREVARFYLHLVGIEKFANSSIHELSGGMRQRVALARSLAPNPRILLMDEAFGALDAMTREQLYGELQDIWQKRRKTIIFVTHNIRESVCLGDRVMLFATHPGRIVEEFKVDLPRPRNINDAKLTMHAAKITAALKHHIDGTEVAE